MILNQLILSTPCSLPQKHGLNQLPTVQIRVAKYCKLCPIRAVHGCRVTGNGTNGSDTRNYIPLCLHFMSKKGGLGVFVLCSGMSTMYIVRVVVSEHL